MFRLTLRPERLFILVVLCFWSGCIGTSQEGNSEAPELRPTVILLSLDGVRWDYLDAYNAPNLEAIAASGVRAERLIPVFPTKTFPTHYSIVTGLYPENHGIISNNMVDPSIGSRFSLSNREAAGDPRWWQGEPLWTTAENQGQITATYFWPGSEAPVEGVRPTYWFEYDSRIPGEKRVDQVLDWLDLGPAEQPTFITLYFSDVDAAGHVHGPDSPLVADALTAVDKYIGRLLDGLEARGVLGDVDIIVTSDHGMAETSEDRVLVIDDFVDPEAAHIVEYSPVLMMWPPSNADPDSIVRALDLHAHVTAYAKDDLPARYHLAEHERTPPIIAVADEGWEFATRRRFEEDPARYNGGTHGYDNELGSMAGIFIAGGPSFRRGATIGPLSSIHIYEMVCSILELEPAPNDGSLQAVEHVFAVQTADAPH